MTLSARTGLSLNMGRQVPPSSPRPGVPVVPPAETRPRCKNCAGRWNGSSLLFCDACEDAYLDLMADAQADEDLRQSDTEIRL